MMPEHTIEEMKNSLKCLTMEPGLCDNQESCIQCNFYVPCYSQTDIIVDALQYIEHLENLVEKQNDEIKKLQSILDHVTHDSKELVTRINAGDDVRTRDYCKKNFGDCSCSCMEDFEWRGARNIKEDNADGEIASVS